MAFTGKATYDAGSTLPELTNDASGLIAAVAGTETPLLDILGDADHYGGSTLHQWLEDWALPTFGTIDTDSGGATITVVDAAVFRPGDQLRLGDTDAMFLVTAVNTSTEVITVTRGYGGTTVATGGEDDRLYIVGNSALEGDDAADSRFTARSRITNNMQIFAATVSVSGSLDAAEVAGVESELEYQKLKVMRELMRDLEHSVIHGRGTGSTGSDTFRRSMRGLNQLISSNSFTPGAGGFPAGTTLTEAQLNAALVGCWNNGGLPDIIVTNAKQAGAIKAAAAAGGRYAAPAPGQKYGTYDSDIGNCQIVTVRNIKPGLIFLLEKSKAKVVPMRGRSFHYAPLGRTGDRVSGQIIGEYTLELRDEMSHGKITGLV